jgi:hypothetical protein
MKGHGTQFGRKKEAAIAALLTARNIEEAAKTVGIAPNTLLNWMKVPEFQTEYREARRAAYFSGGSPAPAGRHSRGNDPAQGDARPDHTSFREVRAAECVMNHSSKAIEIEDVEFRVAELERAAEVKNKG